jgi:ribonuclease R
LFGLNPALFSASIHGVYALWISEHTKKVYKIGDQVKVRLVKADMETKKIDFEII